MMALLAGGLAALSGTGALAHDEQAVGRGISQARLVAATGLLVGGAGGAGGAGVERAKRDYVGCS